LPVDLLLKRLIQYYEKNGKIKSCAAASRKVYRAAFKSAAYIYYWDLSDLGQEDVALPEGYKLEARDSMDQVTDAEMERPFRVPGERKSHPYDEA
jgi:hypothetical protein